jgi:transketolase
MTMASMATRDHFGRVLAESLGTCPNALILNCDLSDATRTAAAKRLHPSQFIDCGISEANAVSVAAGLAQQGFRPFVCSFGHFIAGKFLEIFQSVGLNNAAVVIVGTHAGLAIGKDGPTQMGLRDLALMRLLPNLEIIQPADGTETRGAMNYILHTRKPAYLRLCRQPTGEVHPADYEFTFGRIPILRGGVDLLLVAQGGTVEPCLDAASLLESADGMSVGVANCSSLPMCPEDVAALAETYERIVVVEDHYCKGGLAEELSGMLHMSGGRARCGQIAVPDYGQSGSASDLYARYGLDVAGIVEACRHQRDKCVVDKPSRN